MGRYVPPDLEGVLSANQASGKGHALGARAKKLKSQGILTVRFEMPYAVWCSSCPKPTLIGQGVRFNAEKLKVGNYLSTPIYKFTIKHAACGGKIEIQTDPKNTAYVVISGGQARDYGEDKVREGEDGMEILSSKEREEKREDAFAMLEGKKEDAKVEKDSKRRIQELQNDREKYWQDPFALNRALRKDFRAERKVRKREAKAADAIKERMGLSIDLVPETDQDRRQAASIDFGPANAAYNDKDTFKAHAKPLFGNPELVKATIKQNASRKSTVSVSTTKRANSTDKKAALQRDLQNTTRVAIDAFGSDSTFAVRAPHFIGSSTALRGVGKLSNHIAVVADEFGSESMDQDSATNRLSGAMTALVNYESD